MLSLKDPSLLKMQAYINGEWLSALSGQTMPVLDPATGQQIAEVPDMRVQETQQAIRAAEKAFPLWKAKTAKERALILRRWFDLIVEAKDDLAQLMTAEQGKPLSEAAGEVLYGASFVEWYAEEGKRVYGDLIPAQASDKRIMVSREPIGVVAAVTPWNFPNAMITRKCAPALAAGCTMVLKPAEDTPLSALALMVLPAVIGRVLTDSPVIRKLSFTGSTAVGKQLMRQCADTVKKMSLELGGNAPLIVFDDANLDKAVQGAIISKFRNAGQTCVCANRILVQSSVYDVFVEKFSEAVRKLTVGHGLQGSFDQGPMINQAAISKVSELLDDAVQKGARLICGGQEHELGGTFYQPTIIADVTNTMRVAREEIFGPIAPVFRFDTEEEAIAMANDTEYGLAAYFYANDLGRVWRVSEGLEYGMVAVNEGVLSTEVAPFGGVKESGIGREGSRYGIDEYLEMKYTLLGGIN